MRSLVFTPKFNRAFRKFVNRNADLQHRIESTLQQMGSSVKRDNWARGEYRIQESEVNHPLTPDSWLLYSPPALLYRLKLIAQQMEADVFAPNLGTHKLSGKLDGLQSCSCGDDCRVVFAIEQDTDTEREIIVLLDIGTHDEVY
jgi:mRNA interferase YafQ